MPATSSIEFIEHCSWHGPAPDSGDSVRATIIIPTYQAEATLARAIESALGQTMRDIEIIVADDGSTDATWEMVSAWLAKEPRLRALRSERNRGKSAMMNGAMYLARGHWFAVLDADDCYHPDRLSSLVALGERRNVAMVADNQFLYDAGADAVVAPAWPTGAADWKLTFDDYLFGADAYDAFNLGMLKPVVRTDFVRSTRLSYDERARFGEDFLYLFELFLRGGDAAVSDTPYYFYTQPFGTVSHQWSHGARRRYDFQAACDLLQSHLREIAGRLSPQQRRSLNRRCRQLGALENFFRARESLARRGARAFIARLIKHPATLDYALRRLFGRYFISAVTRVAAESRQRSIRTRDESSRARLAAHAKN
jgi:succinoglycan biosynthesis protein ExoO